MQCVSTKTLNFLYVEFVHATLKYATQKICVIGEICGSKSFYRSVFSAPSAVNSYSVSNPYRCSKYARTISPTLHAWAIQPRGV